MTGVLVLAGSFPPRVCGVGDYTERLAHHLALQGAPVAVWTREGETEPAPGVYPILSGWDRAGILDLVRQIRAARPSVVHLQYERAVFDQSSAVTLLLPELLRGAGIPLVTTFHALDGPAGWGRNHRMALLPLLLQSQSIVVCSSRQERALARLPGIARKVRRIPVGTGIDPKDPPAARDGNRRQNASLHLVYFGFVWRGRGIETLLRTVAALPPKTVMLEIIGGVRDAEYHAELLALAKQLGVVDRVLFHGEMPLTIVSRHLARADAALLPYPTGASTGRSSLMAAFAHGLPVVTTLDPANLPAEFRDGENLLLAPVGDEASFLAATRRVVENPDLRTRLSQGALCLSETVFAWPEIARQTLALPAYRGLNR
jgi:glycosyltransferase involved in cell wall biosynthesis